MDGLTRQPCRVRMAFLNRHNARLAQHAANASTWRSMHRGPLDGGARSTKVRFSTMLEADFRYLRLGQTNLHPARHKCRRT